MPPAFSRGADASGRSDKVTHVAPRACAGCGRRFVPPVPPGHPAWLPPEAWAAQGIHVGKTMRCARCKSVRYCVGNGCQRRHWPTHRKTCRRVAGPALPPSPSGGSASPAGGQPAAAAAEAAKGKPNPADADADANADANAKAHPGLAKLKAAVAAAGLNVDIPDTIRMPKWATAKAPAPGTKVAARKPRKGQKPPEALRQEVKKHLRKFKARAGHPGYDDIADRELRIYRALTGMVGFEPVNFPTIFPHGTCYDIKSPKSRFKDYREHLLSLPHAVYRESPAWAGWSQGMVREIEKHLIDELTWERYDRYNRGATDGGIGPQPAEMS